MTRRLQDRLRAAMLLSFAPLICSCGSMTVFTETARPPVNAIPDDVKAALGCDVSIPGSGLGVEGRNAEMLGGYRPASLKDGPAISIFWCARAPGEFALVFVRDGRPLHPECPAVLTWPYSPKAALSISDKPLPLEEFVPVDLVNHSHAARRPRARLSGKTAGAIVVDGDDSLSNEFYCHKGVWMVRVLD